MGVKGKKDKWIMDDSEFEETTRFYEKAGEEAEKEKKQARGK
jgi:hypothetical protein